MEFMLLFVMERGDSTEPDAMRKMNYLAQELADQGKLLRGDYRVRIRLVSLGGAEPPVSVQFSARLGYRSYGAAFELARPEAEWGTVLSL